MNFDFEIKKEKLLMNKRQQKKKLMKSSPYIVAKKNLECYQIKQKNFIKQCNNKSGILQEELNVIKV